METTAGLNSTLSTIASLLSNLTSTTTHPKGLSIRIIPDPWKIAMGIMLLVGVVSGIFGNILVLFAIFFNKVLGNEITNLIISNLAVTDLLMSVLPMPVLGVYFVFHWPEWKFGDFMCTATNYIANICGMVSLDTMLLIAIDRYFAIIRNKKILNRRYVKIILSSFWISAAVVILYHLLSGGLKKEGLYNNICNQMTGKVILGEEFKRSNTVKLAFGLSVILILILMYARMGYFIWRLRKTPMAQDKNSRAVKRANNNKIRALKLMFSIVIAFLICWLPYGIATFLRIYPISKSNPDLDPTFVLMVYSLVMLNSSINPVLYALLSRKFRSAYGNIIGRARYQFWTAFRNNKSKYDTINKTTHVKLEEKLKHDLLDLDLNKDKVTINM